MSISVRSLGILIVMVIVLVGWLVAVSASGPRSASADVMAPFPLATATSEIHEPVASPIPEPLDPTPVAGVHADFARVSDGLVPVLESRLRSSTGMDLRGITDMDRDVILFLQEQPQWRADANGDGELNETDIAEFDELWSWAARADFNGDGVIDPDDYAAFVDSYNASETKIPEVQLQSGKAIRFGATIQFESGEAQFKLIRSLEVTTAPAR